MPVAAIYARKSTEQEDRQLLSIDSQVRELQSFAARQNVRVSQVFTESKSAKAPGRPVFTDLFHLVQQGQIDTVLCWKLDRLARNPVDGGTVIWAVEQRQLRTIHTPQRSFVNRGDDKFWMQLEFGMAKKYVDDLSDNVRRGIRAKIERGWISWLPPLGYLNDPENRTIVKDPVRFPLVRMLWDLMLTGAYSIPQLSTVASERLGLRTRISRQRSGRPLLPKSLRKLFENPFYCGQISHNGVTHAGSHEKMVTSSEYDRVQELLGRSSNARPQRHTFAFTGLIKCGGCGASITAEEHVKRHGRRYVYYHCTRRKAGVNCRQRAVTENNLERQIVAFLGSLELPGPIRDWCIARVKEFHLEESEKSQSTATALDTRYRACLKELDELVNLRLKNLLSDEEFVAKKKELEHERARLKESLEDNDGRFSDVLDRSIEAFEFAHSARSRFEAGTPEQKRVILSLVGSNFTLKDGILRIQAQKPFRCIQQTISGLGSGLERFEPVEKGQPQPRNECIDTLEDKWWTLVYDVRTFYHKQLLGSHSETCHI